MKIRIEGNTINTEDIWMITPIVSNHKLFYNVEQFRNAEFSFTIKFFNDKELTFKLNGEQVFNDKRWYSSHYISNKLIEITEEMRNERLEQIKLKIEAFKNKIETVWMKTQNYLPTFNLLDEL